MRYLSIRPNPVPAALPMVSISSSPFFPPNIRVNSSGSYFKPGMTCPPLRPDAPQPGSDASSTQTLAPASARCKAVESPVKPPPIMTTSAVRDALNGGVADAGVAVAAHSEGGSACPAEILFMPYFSSRIFHHLRGLAGSLLAQHAPQEVLGARMLRGAQYLLRRAFLADGAAMQKADAVGYVARKSYFMRDHDHGHAVVGQSAHDG